MVISSAKRSPQVLDLILLARYSFLYGTALEFIFSCRLTFYQCCKVEVVSSRIQVKRECCMHEMRFLIGSADVMQIYAEMIGNVMVDARSTGKYYHCKHFA